MSREKLIAEMARIIGHCESTLHPDIECHNKATGCYCIENPCHNQMIAEKLYNVGYRKQEWISVDERLPEDNGDELILHTEDGCVGAGRFAIYGGEALFSWMDNEGSDFYYLGTDSKVTHWMPLPEAPKMKGGAE